MKLALVIVFIVSLTAYLLFYFTSDQSSEITMHMPWQVNIHDPLHSEVFGVVLNKTTLNQAIQLFGQIEGVALFRDKQGNYSLEAYFGKVRTGPFGARLIANLEVPQVVLEKMTEDATKRVKTRDGSIKWDLKTHIQLEQGARKIKSLTYIPDYSGLDQAYILEQFGQPAQRQKLDETAQLWFYPEAGIRIMIDSEGKDMFEYSAPAQFVLQYTVETQH